MWSDERIEALRKLWSVGLTASEIASRLGYTTRSAICGKARRLKLEYRTAVPRATSGSGKRHKTIDEIKYHGRKRCHPVNIEQQVLGRSIGRTGKSLVREFMGNLPTEPLPPVDTMPAQVSANDLLPHHCRAITADHMPFNADRKIYCGERKVLGQSYCEHHVQRYLNTEPHGLLGKPGNNRLALRNIDVRLTKQRLQGSAVENADAFLKENA